MSVRDEDMMGRRQRVLFLCTGNSDRSQMAEGLMRARYGDLYEVHSAGIMPVPVHPEAVEAMRRMGIDISGQRSKSLTEMLGREFEFVVTLCYGAKLTCPGFPGSREVIHMAFRDPAPARGDWAQRLEVFRRVGSDIERWIAGRFGGFHNRCEGTS
jgi:arsenate reductase